MRPTLFLAGLLVCGFLWATGSPQPSGPASPPATWSADEAQIRAASQASTDAWNRGDLKDHLAIYVEDMTFMTSNGPRPGVKSLEESFSKKYFVEGRPRQALRFEQLAVRPLGKDAALQTGRFVLSGGGAPDQTGWFTLIWVRTAQGWKVVHDHSS